jgi:hypothetical protein
VVGANHRVKPASRVERKRRTAVIVNAFAERDDRPEFTRRAIAYAKPNPSGLSFGRGTVQPSDDRVVATPDELVAEVVGGRSIRSFGGEFDVICQGNLKSKTLTTKDTKACPERSRGNTKKTEEGRGSQNSKPSHGDYGCVSDRVAHSVSVSLPTNLQPFRLDLPEDSE